MNRRASGGAARSTRPAASRKRRGLATTRACTPSTLAPETGRSRSSGRSCSSVATASKPSGHRFRGRGVGGKGHHRLKLIGDGPADWVFSLAALHLTAARVAHETGAYADTYAAAEHLGYLTEPTADKPFPYPTIDEARRIAAADRPRAVAPRSLRRPA
jgi:hypothetical protein